MRQDPQSAAARDLREKGWAKPLQGRSEAELGLGALRAGPPPPPCSAGFTPHHQQAEGGGGAEAGPHTCHPGRSCATGPVRGPRSAHLNLTAYGGSNAGRNAAALTVFALFPRRLTGGQLYASVLRRMWRCHPSSPPELVPLTSVFGEIIFLPVVVVKGLQNGGPEVGGA